MTVLSLILISIMTVEMFVGMLEQRENSWHSYRMLERENRRLELEVELRDHMFGKYVDSISDDVLHDFYPEVNNLDSLRRHLKEMYEIKLRKDNDGLCY